MTSPSDQIRYQTTELRKLVAGVKPDQWTNATPCDKWTVRDLVNHLAGGGQMFAASFRGETIAMDPDGSMPDMVGDDPLGAIDAALDALESAASTPGAMDGDLTLPFATLPAPVALGIVKFDILVHCYDIACATGQTFDPPADVVAEGQQMAETLISIEMRNGDTFGAVTDAPANATPMQKLAAFSGRSV